MLKNNFFDSNMTAIIRGFEHHCPMSRPLPRLRGHCLGATACLPRPLPRLRPPLPRLREPFTPVAIDYLPKNG